MTREIEEYSMDSLTQFALKEIDLLPQILGISSESEYDFNKKIPIEIISDLDTALNTEVWNNQNVSKCLEETKTFNEASVGYLWGAPSLGNLTENIGRTSLYLDKLVIDDPITPCLLDDPYYGMDAKSNMIYNHSIELVKLKDWIEADILKILPVSTKFWFENQQVKEVMTENLSKYKDEETDFIMENTEIFQRLAVGSANKSSDFDDENILDLAQMVVHGLNGQILEIEQSIYFNQTLNTISTLDDFEQWKVLNWRLEKAGSKMSKESRNVLALQNLELKFLNNVSTDFALKIREEGYISDLREFFRNKFTEIEHIQTEDDFLISVSDINTEIKDELKIYERDIKSLNSLIKVGGAGSLGILGMSLTAFFGYPIEPPLIALLTGVPLLGIKEALTIREQTNNPLNLLLEVKKTK